LPIQILLGRRRLLSALGGLTRVARAAGRALPPFRRLGGAINRAVGSPQPWGSESGVLCKARFLTIAARVGVPPAVGQCHPPSAPRPLSPAESSSHLCRRVELGAFVTASDCGSSRPSGAPTQGPRRLPRAHARGYVQTPLRGSDAGATSSPRAHARGYVQTPLRGSNAGTTPSPRAHARGYVQTPLRGSDAGATSSPPGSRPGLRSNAPPELRRRGHIVSPGLTPGATFKRPYGAPTQAPRRLPGQKPGDPRGVMHPGARVAVSPG